jgi:hypothetical protein
MQKKAQLLWSWFGIGLGRDVGAGGVQEFGEFWTRRQRVGCARDVRTATISCTHVFLQPWKPYIQIFAPKRNI